MATPYDANQSDFLGEGTAAPADAPPLTAAQIEEARLRKAAWLRNQGLDENGKQLPAYGTPASQGGTATQYIDAFQPAGGIFKHDSSTVTRVNPDGSRTVVGDFTNGAPTINRDGTNGTVGSTAFPGANSVGNNYMADPGYEANAAAGGAPTTGNVSGGAGNGASFGARAGGISDAQTKLLEADILRRQQGSTDQFNATTNALGGSPLTNPLQTQQAGNQAARALGPAPTIDPGLADRGLGDVNAAYGMQRTVFDKLLNGPSTAARVGSQTLRNQLALARSAAGGPGAVQEALRNAQMQAPELQAAATQSAVAEDLQRQQAAGNVASAAGTTALGARGQDVQVAAQNQQAANNLINNITQLTGTQLQLDQQNQELLGQMARDLAAQNFNWGQLSAQQQQAEFERWVKTYGIDVAAAAQIRAAAANDDKGVMDYLIPIIGSAATVGAAAVGGPGAGAAVAAGTAAASR